MIDWSLYRRAVDADEQLTAALVAQHGLTRAADMRYQPQHDNAATARKRDLVQRLTDEWLTHYRAERHAQLSAVSA